MGRSHIAFRRLFQQQISQRAFTTSGELVTWMGAVQAQDYPAAKWALGLRIPGATDAMIHQAVARGEILRTHVMRPTWHFVAPADIRWMLALTASRVNAAMASNYRRLELDEALLARTDAIIARAVEGGRELTRAELALALREAGIAPDPSLRMLHITLRAELDGVICSGAWRGKLPTFALLEERVPSAKPLARDEALAELVRRFFTSHGPATLKDFVWWSGLTLADARAGVEMVKDQLAQEVIAEKAYWFAPDASGVEPTPTGAFLLPNFDEYAVGYADRSAIFDALDSKKLGVRENVVMTHVLVWNGRVVGVWKRTFNKKAVHISIHPFEPLSVEQFQDFYRAACRYAEFLQMPLIDTIEGIETIHRT
jgi:hypothetical protein